MVLMASSLNVFAQVMLPRHNAPEGPCSCRLTHRRARPGRAAPARVDAPPHHKMARKTTTTGKISASALKRIGPYGGHMLLHACASGFSRT